MRVLLINKFLYPKGGDAISTINTGNLLLSKGHKVAFWGMDHPSNPDYPYKKYFVSYIDYNKPIGLRQKMKSVADILYSFEARNKVEKIVRDFRPDIVHLNNFAHQISPSVLDVFKKYKIPAVFTMHDYKMVCACYTMLVRGKICERCRGGRYYHCFLNRCTKNSLAKSFVNTIEMYLHHNILRIYDNISVYISPSKFLRDKVLEMGLKGRVEFLFNFVDITKFQPHFDADENSIVYVGRLSYEKGIETLINAVRKKDVILKIIGDGPIREELHRKVEHEGISNVKFLGYKKGEELYGEIKSSMFLVIPSEWYENNPRTVIEAFALGKPVVGARIGGIPELVKDNERGLCFEPGNVDDLSQKIERMISYHSNRVEIGHNARKFVEEELNSDKHYNQLIKIYNSCM